MKTVSVDFDGVIHSYENGWGDGSIYGTFIKGAIPSLVSLMGRYAVVIHTTRNAKQVARWIEKNSGGRFRCTTRVPRSGFWNTQGILLITDRKLPSFAYIDDRAIPYRSWSQALTALAVMEKKENNAGTDASSAGRSSQDA